MHSSPPCVPPTIGERVLSALPSGDQGPVKRHRHRSRGTSLHTKLTGTASLRFERYLHLRPLDMQGSGRAYSRTCTTLVAFLLISANSLRNGFNLDPDIFQILDTLFKITPLPSQFENNHTLLAWKYLGLQYVEGQSVVPHQIRNNRFIHYLLGKPKN